MSTGVYVDDINAVLYATLLRGLGILAVLASVLLAVVTVLNRGILRSLGGAPAYAAEIATRIAQNDLTLSSIPPVAIARARCGFRKSRG